MLLAPMNSGNAHVALTWIEKRIRRKGKNFLTLRELGFTPIGRISGAIDASRVAVVAGAPGACFRAGLLLAKVRRLDEGLTCRGKALSKNPANPESLDAIVTTCFYFGRNLSGQST